MGLMERPIRLNSRSEVITMIEHGQFDPYLAELARAVESREAARREEVMAKVREVFGSEYDIQVTRRSDAPVPAPLRSAVATNAETIEQLVQEAVEAARIGESKLLIEYVDAEGARTRRVIEPLALRDSRFDPDHRLLWAMDVEKNQHRNFRLDRIKRVEVA